MSTENVLVLPKITVPKNYRTIFINDKRFYLNLPELHFFYKRRQGEIEGDYLNLFVWIMKNNKRYYVPLPNISLDGYVCLGNQQNDPTESIHQFFNSYFKINAEVVRFPSAVHEAFSTYAIKYMENQTLIVNQLCQKQLQFFFDNPIPTTWEK